jgi:biopolymer transport protein TolR
MNSEALVTGGVAGWPAARSFLWAVGVYRDGCSPTQFCIGRQPRWHIQRPEPRKAQASPSEINVTPLIDVLLVMLIIFTVIVPVMPRGLNSALPSPATPGVAEVAERPILVEVEQGEMAVRYLVDGVGMEKPEVAPRLLELLSRRSIRQVLLKADAKLDFGVVAGVIEAGQSAGAESVGLLTPGSDASSR